jgi:hypothetical protein
MASVSEQDKLRLLLPHWIEHNEGHAKEFRRWAENGGPAREDILRAAAHLEEANQILTRALKILGGPLEHHHPYD